MERLREPDRNRDQGGRSFYFFDFDDNVAFLATPTFLYHKETGAEIELSSRELAIFGSTIGKSGPYANYEFDLDPQTGSFRHFRDRKFSWLERLQGRQQMFVQDLRQSLLSPDLAWKGPSWNCFYHAVFNGRPVSLITARGHHPRTLQQGIRLWVDEGHLPCEPNYLSLFPVNYPEVKARLNLPHCESVPLLKQKALRASVELALQKYGESPHHRFGMSDDDPRNIEWIIAEMRALKRDLPRMSFFVIQTHGEQMLKHEIFTDHVEGQVLEVQAQLSLFDSDAGP